MILKDFYDVRAVTACFFFFSREIWSLKLDTYLFFSLFSFVLRRYKVGLLFYFITIGMHAPRKIFPICIYLLVSFLTPSGVFFCPAYYAMHQL